VLTPLTNSDPPEIGPFRLQSRIGAGGMGTVYLGFTRSGTPVAIKVPSPALATDPEFRGRFRNEVAAARKVRGSSVAEVVDADVDSERPWMATAYIEGTSLAEAVGKRGPLDERLLSGLAIGLADALVAIHAAGVVHRDLKPSNILMAWDGPKVIDFGIARSSDGTSHTRTGMLIGTLAWMAPEQLRGEAAGPATDIFAWGACLLFASLGRQPFRGEAPEVVAFQIMSAAPDLSAVPPGIAPLVRQALEKDPALRPTASELVGRLSGRDVRSADDADDAAETMLAQNWSWASTPPGGNTPPGTTGTPPAMDAFFQPDAATAAARSGLTLEPVYPPGHTPPPGRTSPPGGNRSRDSRPLIVLGVALLVVVAVVAALLLARGGGSSGGNAAGGGATTGVGQVGSAPATDGTSPSASGAPSDSASPPPSQSPSQSPSTLPSPSTSASAPVGTGQMPLSDARKAVLAKGYTPSDDSAYAQGNAVNVIIGTATGSSDGYNQLAFFFANGKLLGTDTSQPSATIALITASSDVVRLRYAIYAPADAPCCSSQPPADVRYRWDGTKLRALDPIPPADPAQTGRR
jgi:serine/threonine protein kinase